MDGNETTEREGEQALLANLRDLIDEAGHGGAARQLGVDRKTLWRVLDSGRLTPLVRKALERRGANPEAARRRSGVDALERQVQALEDEVEALDKAVADLRDEFRTLADLQAEALRAWERRLSAVESQLASRTSPGAEPPGAEHGSAGDARASAPPAAADTQQAFASQPAPVAKPWRPWPEVVTLTAEEGEELVYGEVTPLIVEWRRQRLAFLDRGASRVERARACMRMCELELALVGEHELTLPPSTYPWDSFRLREEQRNCERSLHDARWELARAHCWRFLRRLLTLGLWRH